MSQAAGRDASSVLPFDTNALSDYLAARIDGFGALRSVSRFQGGQSNPTYLLELGPRKIRPAQETGRSVAAVRPRRRAGVPRHRRAGGNGRAGPRGILLVRRSGDHRDALLRDGFRRGTHLLGSDPSGNVEFGKGRFYDDVNRVVARLHAVDPAAVGLAISAGAAIILSGRSPGGRNNTPRPKPAKFRPWTN